MSGRRLFGVRAGGDDGVDLVGGYGSGGVDELLVSGAGAGHGEPGGPVFGCCVGDDGVGLASAAVEPGCAYAFDGGRRVGGRVSGNGNGGQIGSATWLATGKSGKALSFNGSNARVTGPGGDLAAVLTTGMTLEAWVYPTTVNNKWRDVLYKGNDDYFLMATSTTSSRPATGGTYSAPRRHKLVGPTAITANTWTHLAATYDGTQLRLYVNGTQVDDEGADGDLSRRLRTRSRSVATRSTASTSRAGSMRCGCIGWRCRRRRFRRIWRRRWVGRRIRRCRRGVGVGGGCGELEAG